MKLLLSEIINEDTVGLEKSYSRISERKIKKAVMNRLSASPKKTLRRLLIIAAAVLLMITAVTGAAAYSDDFRIFLSEGFGFLVGKSQPLNVSDTHDGITMTVESAVNDGNSTLIIVKFTRENGDEFTQDMSISDFSLNSAGSSVSKQMQLSDDRKTMYYLLKVQSINKITDKKIPLCANDLITDFNEGDEKSDIDLGMLYNKNPLNITESEILQSNFQNFSEKLLTDNESDMTLEGLAFKDSDLCIYYRVAGDPDKSFIKNLVNEDTGAVITPFIEYQYTFSSESNKKIKCAVFRNVGKDDLSRFRIVSHYKNEHKIIGQWKVDFRLEKTSEPIKKKTDMVIQSGVYRLRIGSVNINMLGIVTEGYLIDENGNPLTDPRSSIKEPVNLYITFTLDNGDTVKLPLSSMEIDDEDKKVILINAAFSPVDINKIASISINGKTLNVK